MPQIMTVLGPLEPRSLGHTQVHEHLVIDSNRAPAVGDLDKMLNHPEIVAQELTAYRDAGGRTVVDVTTPDLGRDPEAMRWVSEKAGVQVVMGMGLYREPYYPDWVDWIETDELAEHFVDEVRFGVGEAAIRPGIIGEIGSHKSFCSAREERVFRAAGRAQAETGLALMTHTPPGGARQHLSLLAESGADLSRVAVGHVDAWLDYAHHEDIIQRGAMLSFDQIGFPAYPEDWRAGHIAELVKRGYAERILLSTDIFTRTRLKRWGGAGYCELIGDFLPRLRDLGVSEEDIHTMTVENPARLLAVADTSVWSDDGPGRPSPMRRYPWGLTKPLEGVTFAPARGVC